jgi:2-keto-3-deoxy-L-rhamnonate aldolase RhmA
MTQFGLYLFSTDPGFIGSAISAGVTGIIVDWEYIGKDARQTGYDTEINHNTLEDLRRVRAATSAPVLCRINSFGPHTPGEVENAVAAGASEILLPMVRSASEVNALLERAAGRCGVGILVETVEGIECLNQLAVLPLSRVYVGLNDLGISRRVDNLFVSLADGTVDYIRKHIRCPFGFGGLTVPEGGVPIPCRLLMAEMARLDCHFSFLRRSFCRDTRGKVLAVEVPRIRQALDAARLRSREQVEADTALLREAVCRWKAHA